MNPMYGFDSSILLKLIISCTWWQKKVEHYVVHFFYNCFKFKF